MKDLKYITGPLSRHAVEARITNEDHGAQTETKQTSNMRFRMHFNRQIAIGEPGRVGKAELLGPPRQGHIPSTPRKQKRKQCVPVGAARAMPTIPPVRVHGERKRQRPIQQSRRPNSQGVSRSKREKAREDSDSEAAGSP